MSQDSPQSRKLRRTVTFRQLEILCALAETGGVAAAAKHLHLTQPSASMQLKKLSERMGTPLYEVVGRQSALTAAGRAAVASAQEIFSQLEHLEMHLNALQGLAAGRMSIGVVTSAEYFVPHILGPFCRDFPGIDVELSVGNSAEISRRLNDNQDDLYFFSDPPLQDGLDVLPFGPNNLVVIAPANHPLAGKRGLVWSDIADQSFVFREAGSGTRQIVERHLQAKNLAVQNRRVIASNEGIKHAVLAKLGLAIVPVHTLDHGDNSDLVQLDVAGFPICNHWYLVNHSDKQFSVVAEKFKAFLLNEGGAMLEDGLRYWQENSGPKLPSK
ncbi:MAG: LysR family transcriptional regulator [Spongiibacteraceae bacterium]